MAQIRYLWLLVMCTLVLAVMSCSGDRKSRGVQVGNGMQSYFSEDYKFQLDYESRFKLEFLSQSNFLLYNSTARMQVQISQDDKIKNNRDLKDYLWAKSSKTDWLEIKIGDLVAYTLNSQYYLLSPRNELIYVRIDADGYDHKALYAAVQTIIFDYQKPQINKMAVVEHKVSPGRPIIFSFNFDDKKIGVNGNIYGRLKATSFKNEQNCHKELNFELPLVRGSSQQYTATLEIPYNMCLGHYEVTQFFVSDKVGNTLHLELGKQMYVGSRHKLQKISIEVIDYEKRSPSVPNLKLKSIQLPQKEILAGNPLGLGFVLEDDFKGSLIYFARFRPIKKVANNDTKIELKGSVSYNEGYYISGNTSPFLYSGMYQLEQLELFDRMGRKLILSLKDKSLPESIFLQVDTTREKDIISPKITEIKTEDSNWKKQAFNRIYFKAIEADSGLRLKREYKGTLVRVGEGTSKKVSTFIVISSLSREAFDKYVMEFFIPEELESGEYILAKLIIYDNAGNKTTLQLDGAHKFYESHPIEALRVNIR